MITPFQIVKSFPQISIYVYYLFIIDVHYSVPHYFLFNDVPIQFDLLFFPSHLTNNYYKIKRTLLRKFLDYSLTSVRFLTLMALFVF